MDKVEQLNAARCSTRGPQPWLARMTPLLAALVLVACGGGAEPAAGPAPGHWSVLGSSTAAGVGATPGRAWVTQLADALRPRGLAVHNLAASGALTHQALPPSQPRPDGRPATDPARNLALVLAGRPAAVLLAFPSNDALAGYPAAETAANLLLMRDLARREGVPVILLSSQPRNDAGSSAREAMQATDAALQAAAGDCFVDLRVALSGPGGGIATAYSAGDGVHLNDAGHALVFERLWAVVTSGRCVSVPAPAR